MRRWVMGALALTLPIGVVAGVGVQSAFAKSAVSNAPVAATGTVACTSVAGHIKFDPPLTATATDSSDTATVNLNLSGCSGTGGNVTSSNFTGHIHKQTLTLPSDNCSVISGALSNLGSLDVRWTGRAGTSKLDDSTLTLASATGLPVGNLNGNPGLSFTSQGVSGSFGGTASGELDAAQSATALGAKCAAHGVRGFSIGAGSATQP